MSGERRLLSMCALFGRTGGAREVVRGVDDPDVRYKSVDLGKQMARDQDRDPLLTIEPPQKLTDLDHAVRVDLSGLAPGTTWHYRLRLSDPTQPQLMSEGPIGRFRTAPI